MLPFCLTTDCLSFKVTVRNETAAAVTAGRKGRGLDMTPARKQRRYAITAGIAAVTAAAWTMTIYADIANWPEHIWQDFLSISQASTSSMLLSLVVVILVDVREQVFRALEAAAGLQRARPDPVAATPPPWPSLRSVAADDEPALRNGHAASPRSSGA